MGGQFTFAMQMAMVMEGEMDIVGITTDKNEPVGKWFTRKILGFQYNYCNIAYIKPENGKPLIPRRVVVLAGALRNFRKLNIKDYDAIITSSPEFLMALPSSVLHKTHLIMPGIENVMVTARYKYAKLFTGLFDKIFFNRASKVKKILAAADKEAIKRFVERSKGKITQQVMQFPTRYDSSVFHIQNKEILREKYGIDAKQTIVITTGRLNTLKGWQLMIEAFELFSKKRENAHFIMIGDGEDKAIIEQEIEQKKIKNITLLGRKAMKEIADYLSMSDLFIMGSYIEGWSTSLVEAVACGVPCVVTNFSSASDMIKDGVNGYVVTSRDASLFADRMYDALSLNKDGLTEANKKMEQYSIQNLKQAIQQII